MGGDRSVLTAAYSFDDQYSVDPVTKAETYVTRYKYYDQPSYNNVHASIDKQNQEITARNDALRKEYTDRVAEQSSILVPVDELTKIVSSMEVSSKPVEERVLRRTQQIKSNGIGKATEQLQENMKHLTGGKK